MWSHMPKVVRCQGPMVMQNSESASTAVGIVCGIYYQGCVTPAAESEDIDMACRICPLASKALRCPGSTHCSIMCACQPTRSDMVVLATGVVVTWPLMKLASLEPRKGEHVLARRAA
jgi:hypothetical protein